MADTGIEALASDNPMAWVPADTFAARLVVLRRELGLNQREMAALCQVSAPTLNTWENGSMPQKMAAVVNKIAAATGCDRQWLMWGGALRLSPNGYKQDASQPFVLDGGKKGNSDDQLVFRFLTNRDLPGPPV